jgi:hypothetical protein
MNSNGQGLGEKNVAKELTILNGPSSMDLMFSLFHKNTYVRFIFLIRNKREVAHMRIDSLRRMDEDALEWVFESTGHIAMGKFLPSTTEKVLGKFNTQTRKGNLLIVS